MPNIYITNAHYGICRLTLPQVMNYFNKKMMFLPSKLVPIDKITGFEKLNFIINGSARRNDP